MKIFLRISLLLCFMTAPELVFASTQTTATCGQLRNLYSEKFSNALNESPSENNEQLSWQERLEQLTDPVFEGLDPVYRKRVRPQLLTEIARICAETREDTPLEQAVGTAAVSLGLDLDQKNWGMTPLPEIDIETFDCQDFTQRLIESIKAKSSGFRLADNPLVHVMTVYVQAGVFPDTIAPANTLEWSQKLIAACKQDPAQKLITVFEEMR